MRIYRERTTPRRSEPSRPVRAIVDRAILQPGDSIFDYGCGYGTDLRYLRSLGYPSSGFDPAHHPGTPQPADVVLLLFVLNVIEAPAERERVLWEAFSLAGRALVVAVTFGCVPKCWKPYGDGHITTWKTFEKLYSAAEIRSYLRVVSGVEPEPLVQGTYLLPKPAGEPTLAYHHSPSEVTRTIERLKKQRTRLGHRGWIPSARVSLQTYTTGGYEYFQLRSCDREIPSAGGLRKVLHVGKRGGPKFLETLEALARRERRQLLDERLAYLRGRLKTPSNLNEIKAK